MGEGFLEEATGLAGWVGPGQRGQQAVQCDGRTAARRLGTLSCGGGATEGGREGRCFLGTPGGFPQRRAPPPACVTPGATL